VYLLWGSRAACFGSEAVEGLSVKRTDFESLREEAAVKSEDRDGSLGVVRLEGSEGWEPWNCELRSEYWALSRVAWSEKLVLSLGRVFLGLSHVLV
jgi:hypothetical protein